MLGSRSRYNGFLDRLIHPVFTARPINAGYDMFLFFNDPDEDFNTILADIPRGRTYINAYDSKPYTLDALVENLLAGADAFRGTDPIDSFCGLWGAKI